MPKFSVRSQMELATCDADLQDLFDEVILHVDCAILEGEREEAAQNEAFRTGRSTKKYPMGKHNKRPSQAVDAAPYPIDWKNTKRFYYFAGIVKGIAIKRGLKIRWGGDWDSDYDLDDQNLFDLVHFEIV